jgi:adenine-specific DNA-methyltransferase
MDKLKMHSPNLTLNNIDRLRELFPSCVTEACHENGELRLAIDFDLLRQELSESIVEGPQERYHLNWPGKREALLTANAPIAKSLRPYREESVNFDSTKNIFIEGDNLDALKLLQETYLGKVKMIYIDPPYNTGNDFIYDDDFSEGSESYFVKSNQKDSAGNKMFSNMESNGRFHSDWLTMIYPRLKLAKNLMSNDGVIFISIDDRESANLRKICDEVFGNENFVSTLIWKSGRTSSAHFTNEHEYIICFAKNKSALPLFKFTGDSKISDRTIKKHSIKNPTSEIHFPAGIDFECEDKIFPNTFGREEVVTITKGKFECRNGKLANPVTIKASWTMKDMIENWLNNIEVFDQKGQRVVRFYFKSNGILQYEKEKGTVHPKSIIEGFSTKAGGSEIKSLFGVNYFDYPKPSDLIYTLAEIVCGNSDSIILDFFAGSGTTAHAILRLNSKMLTNHRFILVQIPEETDRSSQAYKNGYKKISDICKQRIRIIGKKMEVEKTKSCSDTQLDFGFRVLKIDTSNMKDVYYNPDSIKQADIFNQIDNIKNDRSPEDLLFQVMLDWGIDLSTPIIKRNIQKKEVLFVDHNAIIACFDDSGSIDEAFVEKLAKHNPLRAIFRDSGFKNSAVKINVEQIFKLISPDTEVKCI